MKTEKEIEEKLKESLTFERNELNKGIEKALDWVLGK